MISIVKNCDCMEMMAEFPDKYFELAIVDPPYSDRFNTDACANNKAKKGNYKISSLVGHKPNENYWNELFRISKNQIIWGANWYKWFGVGGICWFKDNTGNYSPCEYAYQSLNNHVYHFKFKWNGMLQEDMKHKEIRIHPTQKPVSLYLWCLKEFAKPGDKILDTHMGSQSSRIAAHQMGFDYWGAELDEEYFRDGCARFERESAQQMLFV